VILTAAPKGRTLSTYKGTKDQTNFHQGLPRILFGQACWSKSLMELQAEIKERYTTG